MFFIGDLPVGWNDGFVQSYGYIVAQVFGKRKSIGGEFPAGGEKI
jgi:hypothetical protein